MVEGENVQADGRGGAERRHHTKVRSTALEGPDCAMLLTERPRSAGPGAA